MTDPDSVDIRRTWRPATARGEVTARLADDRLSLMRQDGTELWTVQLADIRAVRFARHVMGRQVMMRLDLTAGPDTIHRLEINHPLGGPSEPVTNFTTVVAHVLRRLSEITPDLPYTLGETRAVSATLVALGVTLALVGIASGGAVIADGGWITGGSVAVASLIAGGSIAAANLASRSESSRPLARALEEDADAD